MQSALAEPRGNCRDGTGGADAHCRLTLARSLVARAGQMTGVGWLVLYGAILSAWVGLYLFAVSGGPDGWTVASAPWRDLCLVSPAAAGPFGLVAMWSLMVAGMMLPTLIPALVVYDDLAGRQGFYPLVCGYLMVWGIFSALAACAQWMLGIYAPLAGGPGGGYDSGNWPAALLFLLAGAYQFSPLKRACLSRCRSPLPFFIEQWHVGPLRMGLRMGAVCAGCCWALMLLAMVGGAMTLAFMGLATVLMTAEKLSVPGRWLTSVLGSVLVAAGCALLVAPLV